MGDLRAQVERLLAQCRDSRKLILLIVAIGLLLDNMLLTAVVPIIPTFLYELHHKEDPNLGPSLLSLSNASLEQQLPIRPPPATTTPLSLPPFLAGACAEKINEYLTRNQNTPAPAPTPAPETARTLRHRELVGENAQVGLMFASKPIVQAITNLFVGPLTNQIGYSWPLFFGLILLFLSTMVFAIGSTYATLFLARSMQGVGSAFTSVAGMGMLAEKYPDDRERGNVMAIALGGIALGVLIGPPFGGVMFQFIGPSSPFITLAMLALMDGCLQLLVLQPEVVKEQEVGASLMTLLKDEKILLAAGAITFANAGIAMLEPSLPLWMMDTMDANNWEQGAAFLPASISYLVGTNLFGPLGHRFGRWLCALLGLLMIGLALLAIPMATSLSGLIIPNGMIGFAIGMVDSSMIPMLGYLVDIRHSSVYGSVYAIGDVALCVGYIIGPALSGTLVAWFGFGGLCTLTAVGCFAFAPAMFALRNPQPREGFVVESSRLNTEAVKYGAYTNASTPDEEEEIINGGARVPKGKAFEMLP